jgi:hypothetical protein
MRQFECLRRGIVILVGSFFLAGCAHQLPQMTAPRQFSLAHDTFGFSNETVWNYKEGEVRSGNRKPKGEAYSRRCFVMARAALQFWKFARFDPEGSPLDDQELALRIRRVADLEAWKEVLPPGRRILFPGYPDLRSISTAQREIFQHNIGLGWPIYFRPGNYGIIVPPTRAHQERTCAELRQAVSHRYPLVLWVVNFPSLSINHAVLAYDVEQVNGPRVIFKIYDPNYAGEVRRLEYRGGLRTFFMSPSFYFKGGSVDVRSVYWSPLQ